MPERHPAGSRASLMLLVAGICALPACSSSGRGDIPPSATLPPEVAAEAELADSVRTTYTAADVEFMTGMIYHHAQALTMSRMAPTHGASDPLLVLTARIVNAQKDEIALMQAWLRDRGLPVPHPAAVDASAHDMDAGHAAEVGHAEGHDEHMMPGMLTPDQMAALDTARGEEFDRLFLQFMIQHHDGAVAMVQELVATPEAAQEDAVFKLASDISADQSSEITRMRSMLQELLFGPDTSQP